MYSRLLIVAMSLAFCVSASEGLAQKKTADPTKTESAPGPVDAKLYGSTFDEKTIKPDAGKKITPLRSRREDTLYKLSNPRNEVAKESTAKGDTKEIPVLSIDYEIVAEQSLVGDVSLILRTADGQDATISITKLDKRAGTISLQVKEPPFRKGNAKPAPTSGTLPQNFEMYLVRNENGYGKDYTRAFKISNSVIMGETKFPITLARDWTPMEGMVFAIELPKPGLHPAFGDDTEFAGKAKGFGARYVNPSKPLIGLDIQVGAWAKEDCLGNVKPIYDRNYPETDMKRALAKPGYAIGAITVKSNKYVDAIQVTFMKLNEDGSALDSKDSYTSPWLGPEKSGVKEIKLGGDGRKVMGIFMNKAAVLDGIALVMDSKR